MGVIIPNSLQCVGLSIDLKAHCELMIIYVDIPQFEQPLYSQYDVRMYSKWVEIEVLPNCVGLQLDPKPFHNVVDKGELSIDVRDSKSFEPLNPHILLLSKPDVNEIM